MRHGQIGDHKIKSRRPRLEFANRLPGILEPAHREPPVAKRPLEPGLRRLRAEPFRLVAPHAKHRARPGGLTSRRELALQRDQVARRPQEAQRHHLRRARRGHLGADDSARCQKGQTEPDGG